LICVKYKGVLKRGVIHTKYNESFNKINNKNELKQRSKKFPIIGEVDGQGLFLGIELVTEYLHPLAEKTAYVVNRMKEFGILMSSDGPLQNVLKIKPPLTFTKENAKEVIFYLQKVLAEEVMRKF
jgi:4-aminobutyrate aminotransferase-like enzyme